MEGRSMLFAYETERLLLKIIKPDQADAVLDFYMRDKELFEKFEPDRMPNFYTRQFQRQMLLFEYNMAVQGTLFRFYVYEKEHPERIIGTICVHHITRGFSEQCEVGYKFSSAYHHRGYATESLRFIMDLVFRDLKLHRAMAWALPGIYEQPERMMAMLFGFPEFEAAAAVSSDSKDMTGVFGYWMCPLNQD